MLEDPRPKADAAGVGEVPRLIALPLFRNDLGTLGVAEFAQDLGFAPQRMYFLRDVPRGAERGVHAHRRLRQCMLCLNGAVTIELEKAQRQWVFRLDRPEQALLVPPGCWRVLRDFTPEAVVAVLASEPYDPEDYIYTYAEFRAWEAARRRR